MGVGEGLNGVKEKNNLFRLSFAYQCKRLSSKWSFHRLHLQEKGGGRKKPVLASSLKQSLTKGFAYIIYRQHTSFVQRHLSKELGRVCS